MKKIIVTGGAGYIGSHTVVDLFKNGYYPIIIDDFRNSESFVIERLEKICETPVAYYQIDCGDKEALDSVFKKEGPINGVIHFAAYKAVGESVEKPAMYFQNNINSLVVLVEVMKKHKIKDLVFSSSCTVYGSADRAEVNEETPTKTTASPYGYTKQVGEDFLRFMFQSNKDLFNIVLLRYFNPIGAHPSALIGELPLGVPNNLVPFVTQTAAGIRSTLTVFGSDYSTPDGTCIRDYIHVCDLAEAHVKALSFINQKKEVFDIFNIGTGKGTSVLEIIRIFEETNKQKVNYKIGERRPGDVEQIFANVEKAHKILNWESKYNVADALKHAWKWEKSLH